MLENQLLKLLLSHNFYLANRDRISPNFWEGELKQLYETIVTAQEKYKHDLTLDEVKALHNTNNPTLSRAAKNTIAEIFVDLELMESLSEDVGADVLEGLWKRETFRQIAELGLRGVEGQLPDLEDIRKIVDKSGDSFIPDVPVDYVSTDLDDLLEATSRADSCKINIGSIAGHLPGLSGGEFMIIGARPNVGKSAAIVTLTCAPGGFAWQGKKVLIVGNEEPAKRTLMRCVTAACQKNKDWVNSNKSEARKVWNQIKDNVTMVDAVGLSMRNLDTLTRKHKPDVLIIDQADKVSVYGNYGANHEKLREVYVQLREIAKKYDSVVIGVSQVSAEGEGKSVVTYSMLEGSKTGKAAEADVICLIGKYQQGEGEEENLTRTWTISKNKISGWHGTLYTMLDPAVSTYRS